MAVAVIENVVRRKLSDPEGKDSREYYIGVVSSDLAKDLTFVPVVEESKRTYLNEDTTDGYQRPGSASRMRLFSDYLRAHPLSVVPPVILSGRDGWTFDEKSNSLKVTSKAAIIDGQHRLGGYVHLYGEDQVPRPVQFVLLPNLDLQSEKDEFVTINTTQKGVSKSLTAYIGASDEAVIGQLLNEDDDSPFKGKITIAATKTGALFSLAAVAKNIERTFSHGAFEGIDLDQKLDIVKQYWTQISDCYPEEWSDIDCKSAEREYKLLETTGLIAWSHAGSDILGPAFNADTKTMDWERVEASIAKVAETGCVDWRKDGEFQGRTGEYGGREIHKKLQLCLQLDLDDE